MLDSHAVALQLDLREDLGQWLRRRLKNLEKTEREAQEIINKSGKDVAMLAEQWLDQRQAQMSLRRRTYITSPILTNRLMHIRCTCKAEEGVRYVANSAS